MFSVGAAKPDTADVLVDLLLVRHLELIDCGERFL